MTTQKPLLEGGERGCRYALTLCGGRYPWRVEIRRQGHYFESLREALCYLSGRGYFSSQSVTWYQIRAMEELDRQLNDGRKYVELLQEN